MFLGRGVPFGEMDECLAECGIDGAVLTSTDLRQNQAVVDFIKASGGRRYWFFPWVRPSASEDMDFLRGRRDAVNGIKFHPSCDRIRITDRRVRPFLDFAARERLPVMVHCGRWQEMSSYRLALEVAQAYPSVKFILSHMGGDTPELEMATTDAIASAGLDNIYLGIEGVREYWAVQRAVDELGASKVIFGSDFPLGHPRMYLGLVDALKVSSEDRDMILGGNILRLLEEVT
jgi:predicted TIM-barrel fold metal-dependent hydrolase